jgi:hypothetical protein
VSEQFFGWTSMRIALGTFASSGIEAHLGDDIAAGVRVALSDYARRLESGPAPIGLPRFIPDCASQEPAIVFDLPVDEDTRATLEREAARQGTTVSRLAVHGVLVYLAELDSPDPVRAWA